MAQLLLWILALPLLVGIGLTTVRSSAFPHARWLALTASLANLALTLLLTMPLIDDLRERPKPNAAGTATFTPVAVPGALPATVSGGVTGTSFNLVPLSLETPAPAIQLYFGVDGLNIWLILLTGILFPAAILVGWNTITQNEARYYGWLLILQATILGALFSFDILLFYICFELTLVPVFFLIGGWGSGAARREAARTFFLYTLAGGLITLLGVLMIVAQCSNSEFAPGKPLTFSIPELVTRTQQIENDLQRLPETTPEARAQKLGKIDRWRLVQTWAFLALIAGFAVKVPLLPVHTWLPLTYTEAPYALTVLLSGILAKLGTLGFVRLCLPLLPDATLFTPTPFLGGPLLGTLASLGILYGAFCAFAQRDLKRLLAYSSVSHLGFCVLGLVVLNTAGVSGGVMHMLNHGLATGALFMLGALLAERYGTRNIADMSGLMGRLPVLTTCLMILCLSSIGVPGLNNFVSEMLMLGGVVGSGGWAAKWFTLAAALGLVLGAWYTLTLVLRVLFGPVREPETTPAPVTDLNLREITAVVPLVVLCAWIGLFPQPILATSQRDVAVVVQLGTAAQERAVSEQKLRERVANDTVNQP